MHCPDGYLTVCSAQPTDLPHWMDKRVDLNGVLLLQYEKIVMVNNVCGVCNDSSSIVTSSVALKNDL